MNLTSFDSSTLTIEREDVPPIQVGSSVVCRRTGKVQTSGNTERLRRKELELMSYLYENASRVVTRDELLSKVWNCSAMLTRTIDQTVATLRRKVGDDLKQPKHVITIYGVGYMFRRDARDNATSA